MHDADTTTPETRSTPVDGSTVAEAPAPIASAGSIDVAGDAPDLAAIEADLGGVEAALERLDAGTYWTDEVTGETLPDHLLADDPVARRLR